MKKEGSFKFVYRQAKGKKIYYIFSILFAIVRMVLEIIPFIMLPDILNKIIAGDNDTNYYLIRFSIIFVLLFMSLVFKYISTSLSHKATFACLANIRYDMLDKMSKMSLGDIEKISVGKVKNIVIDRVDKLETTMAHIIPEVTSCLVGIVILAVYLFAFIDYRLGFAGLISIFLGFFFMSFMYIGNKKMFQNAMDKTNILNSTAVDYINGIEVIKVFGKEEDSYEKFKTAAHDGAYCFIDWQKKCNIWFALGFSIAPAVLLGILPIGSFMLMKGIVSLSDFIMAIITAVAIISPVIIVFSYQDDLAKVGIIIDEVNTILNAKELVRPEELNKEIKNTEIEINNISFAYEDKKVIDNVSLDIKEGEFIALVGPSGAGKSTLGKLIASYYDVDNGKIKIGGVNIKDIPLATYNKYISYVNQNNYLFNMDILENIRVAKPNATDEEIIEICKKCGCHDFIMNLENGYHTIVGSKGGHISGGERQRITIARAMLKDAPIIILDEATAYTDPENEVIIERAISNLVKGKTLIVIAHRLSTIVNADKIIVVNDGKIVESGSQDELLKNNGLYKKMWQLHLDAKDKEEELC